MNPLDNHQTLSVRDENDEGDPDYKKNLWSKGYYDWLYDRLVRPYSKSPEETVGHKHLDKTST